MESFGGYKQPEKDHGNISSELTLRVAASYNYWHTLKVDNCVTRQITTHVSCRSRFITVLKPESYVGHCPHKPQHGEIIPCGSKGQDRAGVKLKVVQLQPLTFWAPSPPSRCCSTNPTFSLFCYVLKIFTLGKQTNALNFIYSNTLVKQFIQSDLYTSINPISFFWQVFGGFLPQSLSS